MKQFLSLLAVVFTLGLGTVPLDADAAFAAAALAASAAFLASSARRPPSVGADSAPTTAHEQEAAGDGKGGTHFYGATVDARHRIAA